MSLIHSSSSSFSSLFSLFILWVWHLYYNMNLYELAVYTTSCLIDFYTNFVFAENFKFLQANLPDSQMDLLWCRWEHPSLFLLQSSFISGLWLVCHSPYIAWKDSTVMCVCFDDVFCLWSSETPQWWRRPSAEPNLLRLSSCLWWYVLHTSQQWQQDGATDESVVL